MNLKKTCGLVSLVLLLQGGISADTLSVYFIGNSLTNDIPEPLSLMIQKANTWVNIKRSILQWGGSTLADHWQNRNAEQLIKTGQYDYVVIQESKHPAFFLQYDKPTRDNIATWGKTYIDAIHSAGSEAIVYCTMGYRGDTAVANDSLIAVETRVAENNNAILAPVGAVARQALLENPGLELWSDGVHNNSLGIYLVSCVFFCVFTGESPVGSTFYGQGVYNASVTPEQALWAQNMAWKVMSTKYPKYLAWIKNKRNTAVRDSNRKDFSKTVKSTDGSSFHMFVSLGKSHGKPGVYFSTAQKSDLDIKGRTLQLQMPTK